MAYLRRYKGKNVPFFLTTSTYQGQKFFFDQDRWKVAIDYIFRAKEKMVKYLLAFVLMP